MTEEKSENDGELVSWLKKNILRIKLITFFVVFFFSIWYLSQKLEWELYKDIDVVIFGSICFSSMAISFIDFCSLIYIIGRGRKVN